MDDRYHELFERLRAARFPVGPDQYLRMRQLLSVIDDRADDRVKTMLAPIFAGSREQQERFYDIFDEVFPATPPSDEEGHEESGEPPPPPPVRGHTVWLVIGAAILIAVLYAVLRIYTIENEPKKPPQPQPPPEVEIYERVRKFVMQRLPALSLKTIAAVLALALLAAAIAAVIIQEWRRRRRRIDRGEEPPYEWSLRVPTPPQLFDPVELLRLARALKGREEGEQKRLHVRKTIFATISAGGDPQLVYRSALRMPEYIMLVERVSERDHQAIWFDRLASALAAEGVPITRYWFEGDPRVVWSTSRRQRVRLRDLHHRWPDARLLICTDPAALLHPISGELHAGVSAALEWGRQIVVTLSDVRRSIAGRLERHVELIAGADALERLTEGMTGSISSHRNRPPAPDPLSDDARRWLRACAAHPQLEWDLTLALGAAIVGTRFGRVIRELLPMSAFRRGVMRTADRLALVNELAADPPLEQTARGIVKTLLRDLDLPPASFAARERHLQLIGQEIWLRRHSPDALHELYGELREFRIAEIGRDSALLRLLSSAPGTRVLRRIPRRLRQLWFRSGIPALGHHDLTGATAAVVLLVLIIAGTPWTSLRTASGELAQREYTDWERRPQSTATDTTGTEISSTDTSATTTFSTDTISTDTISTDTSATGATDTSATTATGATPTTSTSGVGCEAVASFTTADEMLVRVQFYDCEGAALSPTSDIAVLGKPDVVCQALLAERVEEQDDISVRMVTCSPSTLLALRSPRLRYGGRVFPLVIREPASNNAGARLGEYVSPRLGEVFNRDESGLATIPFRWTRSGEYTLVINGPGGRSFPVSGTSFTWTTNETGRFEWHLEPDIRRTPDVEASFEIRQTDATGYIQTRVDIVYLCGKPNEGVREIPVELPANRVFREAALEAIADGGIGVQLKSVSVEMTAAGRPAIRYSLTDARCEGQRQISLTLNISHAQRLPSPP